MCPGVVSPYHLPETGVPLTRWTGVLSFLYPDDDDKDEDDESPSPDGPIR